MLPASSSFALGRCTFLGDANDSPSLVETCFLDDAPSPYATIWARTLLFALLLILLLRTLLLHGC